MFFPFYGRLFDPGVVLDPGMATSPPYDVISESERRDLMARSPHNIVRLLLPGRDPSSYADAGNLLEQWKSERVLVGDASPRFYVYEMDYTDPAGNPRMARGVMGALELLPLGKDVVPHEETMGKHRADRLSILTATQANLDPIIGLSAAPGLPGLLSQHDPTPRLAFEEADGSVHRLFDVSDGATTRAIEEAVGGHPVSIADGHHRYTTALGYRDERAKVEGDGPWSSIMALVAPAEGSGLTIGPYHRLLPAFTVDLGALDDAFEVTPIQPAAPELPGSIVMAYGGKAFLLRPLTDALVPLPSPWREASAAVAGQLLYPRLAVSEDGARYVADAEEALAAAASGDEVAVLVAPVTERAVADAGEMGIKFPTKTTYFTPKPRAGLVVRCFGD
jgi:uncharacterized protein (DUF1015 family)